MITLTLLGTIHLDPSGPQRMAAALRTLAPQVVLIEFNEEHPALLDRTKHQRLIDLCAKHQLEIGYEVKGAKKYCEEAAIRLIPADSEAEPAAVDAMGTETLDSLEHIMEHMDLRLFIEEQYSLTEEAIAKLLTVAKISNLAKQLLLNPEREATMCAVVRSVVDDYEKSHEKSSSPDTRVVFISGLAHMFSLAKKLADLHPVLRRLNEF